MSTANPQRRPLRPAQEFEPTPEETRPRVSLPAWAMSFILHVLILVVLAVSLNWVPRGTPGESIREAAGEIVLRQQTDEGDYYESQSDQSASQAVAAVADSTLPELPNQSDAPTPSLELPSSNELGIGSAKPGGGGGLQGRLSNPSGNTGIPGGSTRTSFFSVEAEGNRFVYVLDRSGSMSGVGARVSPLNAAKVELMNSLEALGKINQFQIIFYNEFPNIFNLTGVQGRLVFANDHNKEMAHKFIRGITANGTTQHESALKMALGMQPDVIFFLTDADDPVLTSAELKRITSFNRAGTTIHAIEFGEGPQVDGDNFLVRLAKQNGGQHRYVDVQQFSRQATSQ